MTTSTQQPPPPPPPPKSFNEVTIEALEFAVAEIAKHRSTIVQLSVKVARLESDYNALEIKVDHLFDEVQKCVSSV